VRAGELRPAVLIADLDLDELGDECAEATRAAAAAARPRRAVKSD
jgi:hypothetical protein